VNIRLRVFVNQPYKDLLRINTPENMLGSGSGSGSGKDNGKGKGKGKERPKQQHHRHRHVDNAGLGKASLRLPNHHRRMTIGVLQELNSLVGFRETGNQTCQP
jgi:hypothetical protein